MPTTPAQHAGIARREDAVLSVAGAYRARRQLGETDHLARAGVPRGVPGGDAGRARGRGPGDGAADQRAGGA